MRANIYKLIIQEMLLFGLYEKQKKNSIRKEKQIQLKIGQGPENIFLKRNTNDQ